MMPTDRKSFLDVGFDCLRPDKLVSALKQVSINDKLDYIVTPNVDHLVRIHSGTAMADKLRGIYANAKYCLCDSRVLARLARFCGIELAVMPGSDLTEMILARVVRDGDRIAVVGGDPDLLRALRAKFRTLEIVQHRPPMGLAGDEAARCRAAAFIAEHHARFTFICVGSPQQELIAAEAARLGTGRGLALCVGAALAFITGSEVRAPRVVRRLGLEWAHRLISNPRRMWRRYLVEGPRIFALTYRWAQRGR